MKWKEWSKELTDALGLKSSPVSVTYTDLNQELTKGKHRICKVIKKASEGDIFIISEENSACPGGTHYCGFSTNSPMNPGLRDFLINGEKLFSCPLAVQRTLKLSKAQAPQNIAKYMVVSPLEKADLKPDIVIFICTAGQAARIVNLAYYETGIPLECDPSGALCRAVITYPMVTGKLNVSFGDVTARKIEKYNDDELFITLPYLNLRSVVESIPLSSAGTASIKIPDNMKELAE